MAINVPTPATGKTEWKVKMAATATYVLGVAAAAFLSTTATDFVTALPDWAESIAYPALLAAGAWWAGRVSESKADALAPSTIAAAKEWLNARLAR
jgi:hypothetical protein